MAVEIPRQDPSNPHLSTANRVGLEILPVLEKTSPRSLLSPVSVEVVVTGPASRSGPVSAK